MTAARHLRLVRPPDTEPPESRTRPALVPTPPSSARLRGGAAKVRPEPPVQGTLALLFTLPGGAPAVPSPRHALTHSAEVQSRLPACSQAARAKRPLT